MNSKFYTKDQIVKTLKNINLLESIEKGFVEYSKGNSVVPPVGELLFDEPPGDVHIKYGYIKNQDNYVIKIASGFSQNYKVGLSSSHGVMVMFDNKTGYLKCVLHDEGYLTNVRTAVAGAICAKYLAPSNIKSIGIIGTGIQARMQLEYLKMVTNCREAIVLGRSKEIVLHPVSIILIMEYVLTDSSLITPEILSNKLLLRNPIKVKLLIESKVSNIDPSKSTKELVAAGIKVRFLSINNLLL